MTKKGVTPEELKKVSVLPLNEKDLIEFSKKWDDNVLRNKTLNHWVDFSRTKYKNIAKGK